MNEGSSSTLRVAIVVPAKKLLCLGGLLWMQRYGALQVASVVREAGYPVQLFNEELGTRVSVEQLAQSFDVIGFSCKTSALSRAEELAEAIMNDAARRGREVVTVLGGEHISVGGDNLAHNIVQSEIAASHYFEMVEEVEAPFYTEDNGCVELQEELVLRRYQEKLELLKGANKANILYPLDSCGGSCEVCEMPF
jgi:hypothetical protein